MKLGCSRRVGPPTKHDLAVENRVVAGKVGIHVMAICLRQSAPEKQKAAKKKAVPGKNDSLPTLMRMVAPSSACGGV